MDFIDTKRAAADYGLSISWLAKLRLTGNGPAYRKVGKRVLYRRDEFVNWIDSHAQRSTSENK